MTTPLVLTTIIHDRFLSFLIWQTIQSTLLFILMKTLFIFPIYPYLSHHSFFTFTLSLLSFLISTFLFSFSLHFISAPSFRSAASPPALTAGLLRLVFTSSPSSDPDFARRARVTFGFFLFLCAAGVSGAVGFVSVAANSFAGSVGWVISGIGFRAFLVGLLYAIFCIVERRFVLVFPIVQLYAWCARAVASLEVCSHKEDRFGVAQLSGSHGTVISTLLACLLAVETFMGKKINLQSPNHMLGPAGIKWATNSTSRREIATAMSKKRGSPSHFKSYALADVLKTSIYSIVAEFHEEMLASAKWGLLEKEWVNRGKPVYGSVELLVQKLHFFLNFQAS